MGLSQIWGGPMYFRTGCFSAAAALTGDRERLTMATVLPGWLEAWGQRGPDAVKMEMREERYETGEKGE
jgi:hypothetical protein